MGMGWRFGWLIDDISFVRYVKRVGFYFYIIGRYR